MHWRRAMTILGTLALVLSMLPFAAIAAPVRQNADKIEPAVLSKLAQDGKADLIVSFVDQADLSSAYSMSWKERGDFVYNTLRAMTQRSQAAAKQSLDARGLKYQSYIAGNEMYVQAADQSSVNALAALPGVAHIRTSRTYYLDPIINEGVTEAAPQALAWGITFTHADQFWSTFGVQGDGIVVSNIDTGVQYNHPALDQSYRCPSNPGDPSCWADPSNICGGTPCDNAGHGTHTMGTMVADDDPSLTWQAGMAPNATWIACKGCESNSCSDTALNACADWLLAPGGNPANRPDVVNNSWGGGGGDTWYLAKVQAWRAAGIFPAFSAGNNGSGCNSMGSPGDYQESFASAAVDSSGNVASFSSRGPSPFGHDPYTKPNIAAPGVSVCSSVPTNGWNCGYSGTSMASPHSAGAVALLWSCNPGLVGQVDQTFQILQDAAAAAPAGNCGAPPDNEGNYTYGYGYLDVLAAGMAWCGDVGHLDGVVTNSSGGAPIPGATITAVGGNTFAGTTDANGYYTMTLSADTYNVTASKYGFSPSTVNGVVVQADQTTTQNFQLTPVQTYLVQGTVTDANTGWPLYARIDIDGYPEGPVWTNPSTGHYQISLSGGIAYTFHVNAWVPGYVESSRVVGPLTAPRTENFALDADQASCSAPGYHPDCFYFQGFEANDGGFVASGATSWARGTPTSGPGDAHGGSYVWATNPAGQYGNSEDGYLTSPNIDLSSLAGQGISFSWWQWLETEAGYDYASIEVSSNGGSTWAVVYGPEDGQVDSQWTQHTLNLSSAYAVANFRVRFHFTSDGSVTYDGWYIDDICIVPVAPPTTVYTQNFDSNNGSFTSGGTNNSWAWGAPTSGPGSAHSAPNVWATNLGGNYNTDEDSWVSSPNIDLSAYAGQGVYVSWWGWLQTESCCDFGEVQVSNNGGSTWTTVWGPTYGGAGQWEHPTAALSTAYAVSNFRIRFHLATDYSVEYPGFYVDDISVAVGESAVAPCVSDDGGLVVGNVYEANNNTPLVGATVVNDAGQGAVALATPDDPAVDDAFYTIFSPNGNHVHTASFPGYNDDSATLNVPLFGTLLHDFSLTAGHLTVTPDSLHATVMMGQSTTLDLLLGNDGAGALSFELRERDGGFQPPVLSIPRSDGNFEHTPASISRDPNAPAPSLSGAANPLRGINGSLAYAVDIYPGMIMGTFDSETPGTWTEVGGIAGSYFGGDFLNGDFSQLYVVDYDTNALYSLDTATAVATLIGPATPGGGESWTGLTGSPDGILYGAATTCSGSTLYTVDPATGQTTAIGPITNGDCIIDIAINANGEMYGVEIVNDNLIRIDPTTGAGTVVGSIGFDANYAQGMDFDDSTGILYLAAYSSQGELRIADTSTGNTTLVGAFPGGDEVDCLAFANGGASDVPWLSEAPVTGTIAAGSDQNVVVTFDAGVPEVPQPGDYLATLHIVNDTPYGPVDVPVTMTVLPTQDLAQINGTVTSLGSCDVNPAPLEGADVTIETSQGNVRNLTTNVDGYYNLWMPASEAPLTITVTAADHEIGFTSGVSLTPGMTTTVDFDLRLLQPCVSTDPDALWAYLTPGTTTTLPLDLINAGGLESSFELIEVPGTPGLVQGHMPTTPSVPNSRPVVLSLSGTSGSVDTNPPAVNAPVQLVLDDGSRDNDIGIGGTQEFIFVNRFTPSPDEFPFTLNQVQLYFSAVGAVNVGDNIVIVVYENTTGSNDPAPGSNWLASFPATVQSLDAWNVYDLADPVVLYGPGDVIIGVVAMEIPGTDYFPASIDQTASQQRSWAGWWVSSPPPDPPLLPPDSDWTLIDAYFPGNWMIRGYGETGTTDVPWLSENPTAGTIPADDHFVVDVTFTAFPTMSLGSYTATLKLNTDDPVNPTILVPVTMTIVTCIPVHDADFSWAPITPTIGQTVDFTGTALGADPITYEWDLGDGTTATGANVSHAYAAEGVYTVVMTATNCDGSSVVVVSYDVTVVPVACVPVSNADFTWAPLSPSISDTVQFNGTADGDQPISFDWDFGDGSLGTGQNPTHLYSAAGVYTVTMMATNCAGAGVDGATYVITVTELPCDGMDSIDFSWTPTNPMVGDAVDFTASVTGGTGPFSYAWDFGDSGTGTGLTATHSYLASGIFTVTLTVTDACGELSLSLPVTVSEAQTGWTVFLPIVFKNAQP